MSCGQINMTNVIVKVLAKRGGLQRGDRTNGRRLLIIHKEKQPAQS